MRQGTPTSHSPAGAIVVINTDQCPDGLLFPDMDPRECHAKSVAVMRGKVVCADCVEKIHNQPKQHPIQSATKKLLSETARRGAKAYPPHQQKMIVFMA
ncbi:hypothetical protein [Methylobacterium frigidaeris]|uniref:hypothetical protein n=1 Tax=Methylobacterium frigidaeris TaxID=2038277 RepID=UPI001EDD9784|nr:hypothetical protein [Methylobacterium frigidaeris]